MSLPSVAQGATAPTEIYTRTLVVDPVNGNDANAGTDAKPWKSVQVSKIQANDKVQCKTGPYGDLQIIRSQLKQHALITAYPGHTPVFPQILIKSSQFFIIGRGVKVQSLVKPGVNDYLGLVDISAAGNANDPPTSDVILDGLDISSIDDSSGWTQADWSYKGRWFGISVDGGDPAKSNWAKGITIVNCKLKNIRGGIAATANNMLLGENTLDRYCDDGVDFAGSNILIRRNVLTNNVDCGDHNHNDGMQGQIGRGTGGTTVYDNVVIDGNQVYAQTDPALKFPGDIQGISAFDMDWSNLKAINNVIVVKTWHGLSFYSVHGGLLQNNTVLGVNPAAMSWIGLTSKSHQGSPSDHVIVRNNIGSTFDTDVVAGPAGITMDHNLSGGMIAWMDANGTPHWDKSGTAGDNNVIDPDALAKTFAKFDPANCAYDLRLLASSLAIGTGVAPAPAYPDGSPRSAPINIGALDAVTGPTPIPPTPTPKTYEQGYAQAQADSVAAINKLHP